MLTQEEIHQSRYRLQKLAEHDRVTATAMAREERAELLGRIQLCQRLLGEPQSTHEDTGNVSSRELKKLAGELEDRVRSRMKSH